MPDTPEVVPPLTPQKPPLPDDPSGKQPNMAGEPKEGETEEKDDEEKSNAWEVFKDDDEPRDLVIEPPMKH